MPQIAMQKLPSARRTSVGQVIQRQIPLIDECTPRMLPRQCARQAASTLTAVSKYSHADCRLNSSNFSKRVERQTQIASRAGIFVANRPAISDTDTQALATDRPTLQLNQQTAAQLKMGAAAWHAASALQTSHLSKSRSSICDGTRSSICEWIANELRTDDVAEGNGCDRRAKRQAVTQTAAPSADQRVERRDRIRIRQACPWRHHGLRKLTRSPTPAAARWRSLLR